MHQLIATLLDEAPVLTDGAWGTEMQQVGLGSGDCPYEWNLTQPARVEAVARSYRTCSGPKSQPGGVFRRRRRARRRDRRVSRSHTGCYVCISAAR